MQLQLNTGQLQYIRLAQPVSGAQVVQGQIQTLANTQQVIPVATENVILKTNDLISQRLHCPCDVHLFLDHTDRGTAGTAAVQPVY